MKFLKYSLIFFGILILFVGGFFFYGSSSNISDREHSRLFHSKATDAFQKQDSTFSVLTYNIGYLSGMTNNTTDKPDQKFFEANLKKAIHLLEQLNPDIVALQEIDYNSWRTYEMDQETELALDRYPYTARAVNWDKKYVPFPYGLPSVHFGKVVSGQSILSKFKIEKQKIDTLQQVASAPFYYNSFYLERLAQAAVIKIGKKEVAIINVHLEAFDAPTRKVHTEYVLKLYQKYVKNYPTIILGDFNSSPDEKESTILPFLQAGIRSAALNPQKPEYTYSSEKPESRLDYIFYSDHLVLHDSKVVKEAGTISDHLPVMARFSFGGK